MRSLALTILLVAGCSDSVLSGDTAYRRLVDQFDTYDQCIADESLATCYQTITLCENGRVLIDLENRPQDGRYELHATLAMMEVGGATIEFDVEKLTSPQLPGRHAWELVTPSFYGCDVE